MNFIYDDGGRSAAGYKGFTGDCACRAAAIRIPRKRLRKILRPFGTIA